MMGRQNEKKKKKHIGGKSGEGDVKQSKVGDHSPRKYDKDVAVFISMSQELKEEGNKLFQKRDHEGAMLKYEKALKLLPRSHIDVAYLRSNMAACYMQMGLSEYPRAIRECNLALEVSPKYSKALLKRARCYEALNKLDLALRDVNTVLSMEPNNLMAMEISERVKRAIEERGVNGEDLGIDLDPVFAVEPPSVSPPRCKVVKEKSRKKKSSKSEEKKAEDKVVVEEKMTNVQEEEPKLTVKLVFGEDIRWAQLPVNCSLLQLREVIRDRFPNSKSVLTKYKDKEGDLVTITTDEELRWAESSAESQGSIRLYVVEVNPEEDPFFEKVENHEVNQNSFYKSRSVKEMDGGSSYIDDWIIQFAELFKNHIGLNSDSYLDLHELGMKLYSEAMEETVSNEEAQAIFSVAAEKFREMVALALFNWGNVHMSRAKKKVYFKDEGSNDSESILTQVKIAYDWAQKEYSEAGKKFEEALKIKPDFYEGVLALGQQQFEQARLSWYYAIGNKVDLETWSYEEVLQLYNKAEDNMEKGMRMWEEFEKQHNGGTQLKAGIDNVMEPTSNVKSQINILWGTILYERSLMEFKLELPVWHECLEVAVEKFELAGASPTDITVMVKNHCSNDTAKEGLGFEIDEIVQAWNEMYDAKRWQSGIPSFRLEPLFRRRFPKFYHALEHA